MVRDGLWVPGNQTKIKTGYIATKKEQKMPEEVQVFVPNV